MHEMEMNAEKEPGTAQKDTKLIKEDMAACRHVENHRRKEPESAYWHEEQKNQSKPIVTFVHQRINDAVPSDRKGMIDDSQDSR